VITRLSKPSSAYSPRFIDLACAALVSFRGMSERGAANNVGFNHFFTLIFRRKFILLSHIATQHVLGELASHVLVFQI